MAAVTAADLLSRAPMFLHVAPAQRAQLAAAARLRRIRRGEVVTRRGERLAGLLAVGEGMLKLVLRSGAGQEKVLRLVGPGETFGEAVLFLERPVPVDAIAVVESTVALVPAAALLQLFDGDRSFSRALLASLAQRMHALVSDFEAATLHGAAGRAAAYLESLAPEGDAPGVARLPATKTLLASRLGMTKETFSRVLRELSQQGLIRVGRREIALLDRAGLQQLASGAAAVGSG